MTTLVETIEAAVRDGGELMRWAEPNTIALEDAKVEQLVLRALSGPVPEDYAVGVPLLRFADADVADVPLLDAIIDDKRHSAHTCDRCGSRALRRTDRLLVPAGASVVAVHCCSYCRGVLEDVFACGLVWS